MWTRRSGAGRRSRCCCPRWHDETSWSRSRGQVVARRTPCPPLEGTGKRRQFTEARALRHVRDGDGSCRHDLHGNVTPCLIKYLRIRDALGAKHPIQRLSAHSQSPRGASHRKVSATCHSSSKRIPYPPMHRVRLVQSRQKCGCTLTQHIAYMRWNTPYAERKPGRIE
jgi:hypothetical protein